MKRYKADDTEAGIALKPRLHSQTHQALVVLVLY